MGLRFTLHPLLRHDGRSDLTIDQKKSPGTETGAELGAREAAPSRSSQCLRLSAGETVHDAVAEGRGRGLGMDWLRILVSLPRTSGLV